MKWLTTVVGCVVGLLLITAVLVPVIGSYSSGFTEEKVGYNDGFQRYSKVDSFVMDYADGVVQLDGVRYSDIANMDKLASVSPMASIVTEKAIINYYNKTSIAIIYVDETGPHYYGPSKIEFSDGTLTVYKAGSSVVQMTITDVSWAYIPSLDGDYMAADIEDNEVYYGTGDQIIQWSGRSTANYSVISGTDSNRNICFAVVNGEVSDTFGSLTVDSVKMGDTILGEVLASNPIQVLVPYAYHYTDREDNSLYTILEVIPILMVLGIILTVGGMVVLRRF